MPVDLPTVLPKSSQSRLLQMLCCSHAPPTPSPLLPTCMVCRELIKFFVFLFFQRLTFSSEGKGKIKQGVQMRFLSRLGKEFRFQRETYYRYVISGCRCVNMITLLLGVIYVLLCDTGQRLSVTVPDGSLYMMSDSKSCCQLCFIPSVISRRCCFFWSGLVFLRRAECRSLWSAGNPRS